MCQSIYTNDIAFLTYLNTSLQSHFPKYIPLTYTTDNSDKERSMAFKEFGVKLISKTFYQNTTQTSKEAPPSAHMIVQPKHYSYELCLLKISPEERNKNLGSRLIAWLKIITEQTKRFEITLSAEYIESLTIPHATQCTSYLKTLNFYKKNGVNLNFFKKIPPISFIYKHMRLPLAIPVNEIIKSAYKTQQSLFIKKHKLNIKTRRRSAQKRNYAYPAMTYPSHQAYSYTSIHYALFHRFLSFVYATDTQ